MTAEDRPIHSRGIHPIGCRRCHGEGWIVDPNDRRWRPALIRCDHDWWHDDTGWDPRQHEALDPNHPRAIAAYERGLAQGRAELAEMQEQEASKRRHPSGRQ